MVVGVVGPAAVDRDVLADAVVVADDQRAARLMDVHVLGPAADDRPFADLVVAAQRRRDFDDRAGLQRAAVADHRAGFDDAERADADALRQAPRRIDHGGGMNLGHGGPFRRRASCRPRRRCGSGCGDDRGPLPHAAGRTLSLAATTRDCPTVKSAHEWGAL